MHKLKECSMMKNYMTTGTLTKGKKPKDDAAGKATAPFPGRRWSCQSMASPSPMSLDISSNLLVEW
jgi:hypothetical protein